MLKIQTKIEWMDDNNELIDNGLRYMEFEDVEFQCHTWRVLRFSLEKGESEVFAEGYGSVKEEIEEKGSIAKWVEWMETQSQDCIGGCEF